jgi:hypothetical protein
MEMSFVTIKARILGASDPLDRRTAPRIPVEIGARVRELGDEGNEARVLNISETGFMAQTSGEFEVGSRIWLILPGRERANALVRWIAGDKIGAEFAEPITLEGLSL